MLLTKDQILKAEDLDFEEVEVKEWGGKVRVRMMTAGERDDFEATVFSIDVSTVDEDQKVDFKRENYRAELLVRTMCDDAGKLIFTKSELKALAAKGAKPVQRVFEVASKLNALGQEDEDELVKN